ncbi:hypothetical protein D3C86_1447100 [compost metagenome]
MALVAVVGEQLDRVEDHPAVDFLTQAGLFGGVEKLVRRDLFALRAEQAQQDFVVFMAVAAQAADRLEQQAEAVVFQCLLDHGDYVAAVGGRGQLIAGVEQLERITLVELVGAALGAVDHFLGFRGFFVEAGDANRQGALCRAAVDVEQVAFDLFHQAGQAGFCLLRGLSGLQDGEYIVAKACQLCLGSEVTAQQVGQVGEQQVDPRQADLCQQVGITVDADIGQAGRLAGIHRALGGSIHQAEEMSAVVQAGDQILAADFAQLLFQFGIAAFCVDHHLDAGFAVIVGR